MSERRPEKLLFQAAVGSGRAGGAPALGGSAGGLGLGGGGVTGGSVWWRQGHRRLGPGARSRWLGAVV